MSEVARDDATIPRRAAAAAGVRRPRPAPPFTPARYIYLLSYNSYIH